MKGTVAAGRAWNTWDFRYPGCFLHLPSRLAVKVSAYSGKCNRYEDFDVDGSAEIEPGERSSDGDYAALRLRFADTVLGVEFAKPDPFVVVARIRILEQGEILFRFLPLIEFGFLDAWGPNGPRMQDPNARVRLEGISPERAFETPSRASAVWDDQAFALEIGHRPIGASAYPDLGGLRTLLEDEGWLRNPEPVVEGRWAAFRFLGDPLVDLHLALAQAPDAPQASAAAHRTLAEAGELIDRRGSEVRAAGSEPERAVRDVMAWNTIADTTNDRVHTCLSRRWVRGLGGWGVWLTDVLYNALMDARIGDPIGGRENLAAVLAGQQPSGILPCLMAEHEQWIDRSQLPIAATITWRVYSLTRERELLAQVYPALARHLAWWRRERDGNDNGLYEYGSSPVGRAHNTHTRQGAMNESGMDNLQTFDDARFDEQAHTLDLEDVGLNALLSLEMQMLARIAREIGRDDEAAMLGVDADALNELIRTELWDGEREIFAGRRWSDGLISQIAPTSFFPLAAGAATHEQARALVERHLLNPAEFWGSFVLPSTPRSDPISSENSYWRGRIWPPHVFFTWEGLRRYGFDDEAAEVARRSWEMFRGPWEQERHCYENFHISDPAGHRSSSADPFYSWGALIPMVAACEQADVSPWSGVTLGGGREGDSGSLPDPLGLTVRRTDEALEISRHGSVCLQVRPAARLREVFVTPDEVRFRLPSAGAVSYEVQVPVTPGSTVEASIDGVSAEASVEAGIARCSVPVPASPDVTSGRQVHIRRVPRG